MQLRGEVALELLGGIDRPVPCTQRDLDTPPVCWRRRLRTHTCLRRASGPHCDLQQARFSPTHQKHKTNKAGRERERVPVALYP